MVGGKLAQTDLVLYHQFEIISSLFQIVGYILIAMGFYNAYYIKYLPQNTPSV
jgi:hypothetical protein